MKQASKPRKSSSILILRKKLNSFFDYDILFLKRNSKMSFGDTWAFPGGVVDPSDYAYANALKSSDSENEAFKICALRETYEETGLFLGSLGNKTGKRDISNLLDTKDFLQLQNSQSPGLSFLRNFMRLVTIQILPKRFDTYFYLYDINDDNCFNVELFKKNQSDTTSLKNFNEILINKDESSAFKWMDPLEILKKYFDEKNIQLAPPQLFILNILTSLPKMTDLFNTLNKLRPSESANSSNLLKANPFTFPFMIHPMVNSTGSKKDITYLLAGDSEYPLEEVISNEADKEYGEHLRKYYSSVENKGGRFRITNTYEGEAKTRRLKEFKEVQHNIGVDSPFLLLRTNRQIFGSQAKL